MFSRPAIMRSSVDLPQPDGPTSTTNSLSEMSTLTPCSTSTEPNDFRTFRMSTAAIHVLVPSHDTKRGCTRLARHASVSTSIVPLCRNIKDDVYTAAEHGRSSGALE